VTVNAVKVQRELVACGIKDETSGKYKRKIVVCSGDFPPSRTVGCVGV